jgi:hypothetical protein
MREADETRAERVPKEKLRRHRRTEAELSLWRKGSPKKAQIAWQLRKRTTTTLKWIAERLKMGTWTYVSNCLVRTQQENEKCR